MALTVEDIGELLRLVEASAFEEVEIEFEGARLVTRRSGGNSGAAGTLPARPPSGREEITPTMARPAQADNAAVSLAAAPVASAQVTSGPMAPLPRRSRPVTGARQPEMAADLVAVRAPMVGSFFRRPAPDQPPLVELGQPVTAGQPLCLIEVMKLFATVETPVTGIVEAILAEDGALVEYDQPLFAIRVAR